MRPGDPFVLRLNAWWRTRGAGEQEDGEIDAEPEGTIVPFDGGALGGPYES